MTNKPTEEEESQEFLTALLNGQQIGTERLVRLIDLRFTSLARRQREMRQELSDRLDKIESHVALVASTVRVLRWLPAAVPIAGAIIGILKAGGWL